MKPFVALAVLVACGSPTDHVPGIQFQTPVAQAAASAPRSMTTNVGPAQVWELHDQLIDCMVAPDTCEVDQFTAPHSPARRDLEDFVQRRRLEGLVASLGSTPPKRHLVRMWPTDGSVHVELCWVDDLVLMTPTAASNQSAILDDSVLSLSETWTLATLNDGWGLEERRITRMEQGQASWCR